MPNLEIVVKLNKEKGIHIGRTIYLFNKPKVVVGFWNNSLVLACNNPRTIDDAQVRIYTLEELREFYEEGSLQGLVDLDA